MDAHLFLANHAMKGSLHAIDEGSSQLEEENKPNSDAAIAVHCKAGKGRTGVMIITFLLFSEHQLENMEDIPQNVINFYNARRTHNKKGLTIAS